MGTNSKKIEKFTINSFFDIPKDKWNLFVRNNKMGYAYHLNEMVVMDEDDYARNISFTIINNCTNEIVLLMPMFLRENMGDNNVTKTKNILIARKGMVVKDGLSKKYLGKLSSYFVTYIDNVMLKYKVTKLITEMPSLAKFNYPGTPQAINPLIYFGFCPVIRYTWVVDLTKSESQILTDCEEQTRREIRKYLTCEDYCFIEIESDTKRVIDDFITLSELTYGRSGINAKSKQYYEYLISEVSKTIRRIFFIKRKNEDVPIVAAVVLIYNNTARYYLGASISEKPRGISKYLIYCIMIELKRSGIAYFETGGAYPYLRKASKRKGISDFKKCFGAFLHIIHGGEYCMNQDYEIGFTGTSYAVYKDMN